MNARRRLPIDGSRHGSRGFSLQLVLLTILVVATVGTTTVYVASKDSLAAEARERASLARVAAETGLRHLMVGFQPTLIDDQRNIQDDGAGGSGAGGSPAAPTKEYLDVLTATPLIGPVPIPAPPGLTAEYVAWGGAVSLGGTQVIVEGRILSGGNVVARSRISGFITLATGNLRYGQYGATSGNTGQEGYDGGTPTYGGL